MHFCLDCPAYNDSRRKYLVNDRSATCDRETSFVAITNDETSNHPTAKFIFFALKYRLATLSTDS